MQASDWCQILVGMLAPVVVLTLIHIVRRRGVVLAHTGGILGSVGVSMIGLHSLFIVALADNGGGAGNAVLTRLDHIASPIPELFFALPVALTLLAAANVRAGLVPRWVIPVAVLFLLAGFVPCRGNRPVRARPGRIRAHRLPHPRHEGGERESGPAVGAPPSAQPATAPTVA